MTETTKNKQAEPQEWLMPDEIKVIETSDPKVMLDKWLADTVGENWIVDVTKVGKSKITHVIPHTYLKLWRSKNPTKQQESAATMKSTNN